MFINSTAKPSPSTFSAPHSAKASQTGGISSSDNNASNQTSGTDPETGLSVAAKAGIGAGVGGGVLIIALLALIVLLCRKHHKKKTQPTQQSQHPYQIGPPMGAPPYLAQADKDAWHAATYSAGSSPPMMSPYFDPNYQGQYSHIVPSLYSDQRSQRPPSISPPTELSAGRHVHELHSEQSMAANNDMADFPSEGKRDRS